MSKRLREELVEVGASAAEITKLLPIADKLSMLKPINQKWTSRLLKLLSPVSFSAIGLVIGLFVVIVSQSVLPTSWLFPVQQTTDSIAVNLQPRYRENIMMKRAQQVNQLVLIHASSQQILSTLNQYMAIAREYKKSNHVNYAAYDFCRKNLMVALASAPPDIKNQLRNSISSLGNI